MSQVSPYLGGIGISSAVVSYIVALYYNTIIAWCLIYFLHSFESPLPWADCPTRLYKNFTYDIEPECVASSPTQYYWYRSTLQSSASVNDPEAINYPVAIALFVAWFLVYICMVQGITSSGKIVYITAIFPYVVLIIFFFRGITLHGAYVGVMHFFTPRWELLLDPVVWLEAGTQIFFSLGLAFGGLIAFSSYNPANNNCYRDAILVSFTNCGTSMFAGIVVFSIIGFKATSTYEKCLADRNASIAANITTNLPVCDLQRELDNVCKRNVMIFCWRNVHFNLNKFILLLMTLIWLSYWTECVGYRFGIYNIHWSNQSISWRSILGSAVLPHAVYTWHWLTIWYARGIRHISGWYEIIPRPTKRRNHWSKSNLSNQNYAFYFIESAKKQSFTLNAFFRLQFFSKGPMLFMLYHINCVRSRCWQLYIPTDGQFRWQLLTFDHRIFRMYCCCLGLWH